MKNTSSYNSQQIINFKKLTLNLNIFVIIISVLVLIGWIFNIPILKSINPSWIAMRINTAFCFILSSISLFIYLIRDEIKNKKTGEFLSKLLAYITGLFGFLTICQYLSGMNFGIDTILSFENVSNLVEGALPQGRMAANTSLNFLLAGIALNLIYSNNIKIKKISQIISFFIILISLPALIGYCYGAQFEGSFAYFTHMALHTSVVFIALAIAIALSTSQFGYMSIFTKNDSGGVIARRLLPLVVVIPFLVDLLALSGYTQELYGFN